MRNLVKTCLPVLALFALGGCAGTSALTSSEDDGVYYSSKDRTTAVASQAPAPASSNEAANPDYNGNTSNTAPQGSGSTQYYDNTYTYMRGAPGYGSSAYYGPGVSSYTPYSPYTTLSYAPFASTCYGYGYGWGGGACGYSPYAYGGYDPFYGSYYSPYGYGYSPYYGSGFSIGFGFGRSYGYGYSPYSYGYGYSPYYYGGSYYGGYYGRNGYYGNNYYGNSYYGRSGYSDNRRRPASNYHRTERGSEGRYAAGSTPITGSGTSAPIGTGRVRNDQRVAAGSQQGGQIVPAGEARPKRQDADDNPYSTSSVGSYNQPRRLNEGEQPRTTETVTESQPYAAPGQAGVDDSRSRRRDDSRSRGRDEVVQPMRDQPQPSYDQSQQVSEQPVRQRSYDQPQRTYDQPRTVTEQPTRQRSYEQPQRTYEQPQRTYDQPQRSSDQPQRSSQPSYSTPSYGGGGGSNGGGGGGRRGRD